MADGADMALPVRLDHVTVRTADLEATRTFFEDVLGLAVGWRPAFSFPGYWLYAGTNAIVHLVPRTGADGTTRGDALDHAGFLLTDHDAHVGRLTALGLRFTKTALPEIGERRLFAETPGGVMIELLFRDQPRPRCWPRDRQARFRRC